MSCSQGVYVFWRSPKSVEDVIGDVFCPGKMCFNWENCESLDVYVTTPRSIYVWGMRRAWLFVDKILFIVQKHVKTTKTEKTRFSFANKGWISYSTNKCSLWSHFIQSNIERKNYVDNKVQETIADVNCPICRNGKCVYFSTNKTSGFYDCKKWKACCHVLNILSKDQKPLIGFFCSDGTHCLHESPVGKRKTISFLKNFLRQSQSSTHEVEPEKSKFVPSMA